MTVSGRAVRLVPRIAVTAVALVALAAAFAPRAPEEPGGTRVSGPPPEVQNVQVVKAPPLEPVRQSVLCRDCAAPVAPPAGRY